MYSFRLTLNALTIIVLALTFSSIAQAQATRTWVSGTGNDANPCSRTSPCQTYSGAQIKTATGGEINTLDPGGFGAITITKALTIDGSNAGYGGVLASGISGITINITTGLASDKVILRYLEINGNNAAGGFHGIRFLDGAELRVQNVNIMNFTGNGVEISQSQASKTTLQNVHINNVNIGVRATTTVGEAVVMANEVYIDKFTTDGVQGAANSRIGLRNSVIAHGAIGIRTNGTNSVINVDDVFVSYMTTAIQASAASTINVSDSIIMQNSTGLNLNGGTINSMQGNTLFSNTTPGAFSSTQLKV
jgi:hypothetical protein